MFANEVHSLSSWGLVPSQVTKSWHFGLGGLWAVPERGAGSRESGSPEGMMSPSRQSTFEPLSHYVYLRSLTHSGIVGPRKLGPKKTSPLFPVEHFSRYLTLVLEVRPRGGPVSPVGLSHGSLVWLWSE